ncbi:unannotated protein [freshwater metagenome]|uniref:Unannotated protein n=1 Tax=freshwater metagenome TaxID=449393 RepID=A0A6J6IR90_9ZZZZ
MSLGLETDLSAWGDSPLSVAVREKEIRTGQVKINGDIFSVLSIPFVSHGVPTGIGVLILDDVQMKLEFSKGIGLALSKLGAFYLQSLDFGALALSAAPVPLGAEDLSPRQVNILGHIDSGLVNLEIAKNLMLSESTIRQETVKIYRALGVSSRLEAVKKAKSLGILAKKNSHVSSQLNQG